MKKSTAFKLLFALLLAMVVTSCNKGSKSGETAEADYIRYKVVYLEKMAGDIPTNLLPNEMNAYYTKNHVLTKIDGFFGQFSLVQVADLKKQSVISMLNFFGNKIYYLGKKGEIPVGIYPLNEPVIKFTEDTLNISGLLSYKAVITMPESNYDIYYTKEISIKDPNITTPYSNIEYVLCDFRVQLSYLKMRLFIEEHASQKIDPALFEVPDEYKEVTRETMEDIINSLFTKD